MENPFSKFSGTPHEVVHECYQSVQILCNSTWPFVFSPGVQDSFWMWPSWQLLEILEISTALSTYDLPDDIRVCSWCHVRFPATIHREHVLLESIYRISRWLEEGSVFRFPFLRASLSLLKGLSMGNAIVLMDIFNTMAAFKALPGNGETILWGEVSKWNAYFKPSLGFVRW